MVKKCGEVIFCVSVSLLALAFIAQESLFATKGGSHVVF